MEETFTGFVSAAGKILQVTTNRVGVLTVDFAEKISLNSREQPIILQDTLIQLKEYLEGCRQRFDIVLCPHGTDFQQRVWKLLVTIPFGKTISYAQMAEQLGNPKVIRAAASANGKNPISIIIPCHRVIASDGGLGGYSGGLENKKFLLELEKANGVLTLF